MPPFHLILLETVIFYPKFFLQSQLDWANANEQTVLPCVFNPLGQTWLNALTLKPEEQVVTAWDGDHETQSRVARTKTVERGLILKHNEFRTGNWMIGDLDGLTLEGFPIRA